MSEALSCQEDFQKAEETLREGASRWSDWATLEGLLLET